MAARTDPPPRLAAPLVQRVSPATYSSQPESIPLTAYCHLEDATGAALVTSREGGTCEDHENPSQTHTHTHTHTHRARSIPHRVQGVN
ncbi:hypothetical protein E2C01_068930 [Portunus trituberculatus]|uniref:Uncharacterized protein n=1 Tax=Portunus trituberculatus TaxID=210409 RepID=A0A5B7I0V0_PORTR|nr:hypothetical protein [Portunus trituberculatus]